jgi:hypothetical protein
MDTVISENWLAYYWALAKEFGAECLHISRSDMLASVLAIAFVFLINRSTLDMRIAVEAAVATFVTLGILHSARIPWLLAKRVMSHESPLHPAWGALGIVFFVLFVVCVLYVGAWFYTMQPSLNFSKAPDGRDIRIQQLESQLSEQRPFQEPKDSLRRKTIRLADELTEFWAKNPPPPLPNNKDASDYPQKQAAMSEYERRVKGIYEHKYKVRLLEIVRTYKQKGVPTGSLEADAENQIFGAVWFSWSGNQPPLCGVDEVCQLRELSWFVDARDEPITTF